MARIKKEDQIRILASVNEERRPVRAVAAEFGYTPAAIYALLARSRRDLEAAAQAAEQPPLALIPETAAEAMPTALLPEAIQEPAAESMPMPMVAAPEEARVLPFAAAAQAPSPAAAPASAPARMEGRAADDGGARGGRKGLGARLAKPGMGLITRSADGDESMMPFRSLDDLLSAIKPILREGARSADPVWFSIQSIDLAAIDADAA